MEKTQAIELVHALLRGMNEQKASDVFITAGFPPAFKIDGQLTPVSSQALTPQQTVTLAHSVMNEHQLKEFNETRECNFSLNLTDIGRFRVNVFMQQQCVGIVFRTITTKIPDIDALGLPPMLKDLVMSKRGLVLLVGSTGTGKSTTLAAMVGHRNQNSRGHIITVEDPVEFVHEHINCIVTQREIGVDTESWGAALKNMLRQAPDVILIGEIRDRETMDQAIAFAETGHLCLSTLHANNANQALDRIVNFFPEDRREQLLMDLSLNTRALVSQRLIPKKNGKGRVAAFEIMLNSPLIADLIFKGQLTDIKGVMTQSREFGMLTFDQSLFDLFEAGEISYEDALRNADSVNDLRLRIKLESKTSKNTDLLSGTKHLEIT
ncbi:MAG: PilT/PilU family type 4a pilus ATPase [Gallionellaceae bacterium]|jgi:twitching motility protein PilU|nr:PilT/PilU family type 4a pilus ATPase [Gallionellaceae bacterium]